MHIHQFLISFISFWQFMQLNIRKYYTNKTPLILHFYYLLEDSYDKLSSRTPFLHNSMLLPKNPNLIEKYGFFTCFSCWKTSEFIFNSFFSVFFISSVNIFFLCKWMSHISLYSSLIKSLIIYLFSYINTWF